MAADFKKVKKSMMLTELAADYIAREAGRETLITPTRSEISRDRKRATIFVSVFPTDRGEHAIAFLMRHKELFRDYLKKHSRFPVLPYITFEIDYGEINRQRMDELSNEIGPIAPAESENEE